MLAIALHVTEAVGADARAGVNRDSVAEPRAAVHRHRRHEVTVLAQLDAGSEDAVRADDAAASDRRAVADHGIGPDGDAAAEPDATADHGGRVDALHRVRRAVKSR